MPLKLLFAILVSAHGYAEEAPRSIVLGHNLTPTTQTLPKSGFTAGNYILGFGVSEKLTVATSPWLYSSYNMYSAIFRLRGCLQAIEETCKTDWAIQTMYLKTGHFGQRLYQMEAVNSSFVVKRDLADFYSLNVAINFMDFFDETAPFSLRREPYNNDAYQVSLSTLHELRLPGGFGFLIEFGMLGLNYTYPEMHYGLSVYHRSKNFLVQLGFSQTLTAGTLSRLFQTNQIVSLSGGEPGYDFSMHPEVQLQVFL